MLPEIENANLRWDAEKAVQLAEAGHVRGGCAHLVLGLARARRLQRAGLKEGTLLAVRYEAAVVQYAARYRPGQPRRTVSDSARGPARPQWVN